MPTYEYKCMQCGIIEIFHAMSDDNKTVCPQCSEDGLEKQISAGGAVIIAGREANQYSDIKHAQFWRDKNGVKHRVTDADGHTGSATVTKKTSNDAMVKSRKRRDAKQGKKMRSKLQENYAIESLKQQLKK